MNECFAKHPNSKLYFTGHSLGGAMALCAVFYYCFREENPREVHKLFTIGQPITCNDKARNALRNKYPDLEYFVSFLVRAKIHGESC